MNNAELDAIRKRDAVWRGMFRDASYLPSADRRALLAYVDELRAELAALREAAGKVTCETCEGTGECRWHDDVIRACPDCADLRKLMEVTCS